MKKVLVLGLHGVATNNLGERIGSAKVGKDVVASSMKLRGFYHTSFAKPIYQVASDVYGIDVTDLSEYDKDERVYEPWGKTLRQILQGVGGAFRSIDEDFFLKWMAKDIADNTEGYEGIVISDVRFDNEAEFIRNLGGQIVHVRREIDDLENYNVQPDISEAGAQRTVDDIDIFNNGSLEHLDILAMNVIILTTEISEHQKTCLG